MSRVAKFFSLLQGVRGLKVASFYACVRSCSSVPRGNTGSAGSIW